MSSHDPDCAKTIGRYELVRRIGRGGMGDVFEARHQVTRRRVAVKIARHVGLDERSRRRFLREAMAAAALDHPNVVDILDAFESDEGPVVVMERLEGETLAELMRRSGRLDLEAIAAIMVPVSRALVAAHARGMVHRDLKPDNIFLALVTDTGVVPKILDFGIVKLRSGLDAPFEERGQATQTGAIVGTPHYMAYEQATGQGSIDERADIWALGVIVYEALTGRRPLMFRSFAEMFEAFRSGHVVPIGDLAPDLPANVARVVDAMVRVKPADRLDSLTPFVDALQAFAPSGTLPKALVDATHTIIPALSESPTPTTRLPASAVHTPLAAAKTTDDPVPPRRATARSFALVSAAAALVAVLGGLWIHRSMRGAAAVDPVMVPVDDPVADDASPSAPLPPEVEQHDQEEPDAEPAKPTTSAPPPARQGATALPVVRHAPPPAKASPPSDCDPPYAIDAAGVKRFKAHCF